MITWRPMSEHPSPPAATALIRCTDDVDGAHLMPGPVMWSRRDECWVDEGDGEPVLMGAPDAVYEWCYERDIVGAGDTVARDPADAFPQAHRLALELECLLLGTKDTAAVSTWWDSATDALDQWHTFCRENLSAEIATPGAWRVGDPSVDQVHLGDVKAALRDLVATIDLYTDCMSNKIDREALDPWIERAEDLLGQTLEEILG